MLSSPTSWRWSSLSTDLLSANWLAISGLFFAVPILFFLRPIFPDHPLAHISGTSPIQALSFGHLLALPIVLALVNHFGWRRFIGQMPGRLVSIFVLFALIDIVLRLLEVGGREPDPRNLVSWISMTGLLAWMMSLRRFEVRPTICLAVLAVYVAISVICDVLGWHALIQDWDVYAGYINWLTSRFGGITPNTNFLGYALLLLCMIYVLGAEPNRRLGRWDVALTIAIVILCALMKGRMALETATLLGLLWWSRTNLRVARPLAWLLIATVVGIVILSVHFTLIPLQNQWPYLNFEPSFYALAQGPHFGLLTHNGVLGHSMSESRALFPTHIDPTKLDAAISLLRVESAIESIRLQFSTYQTPHNSFLDVWSRFGPFAAGAFLLTIIWTLWIYVRKFGLGLESQVLAVVSIRYFHHDIDTLSVLTLGFTLVYPHLRAQTGISDTPDDLPARVDAVGRRTTDALPRNQTVQSRSCAPS